MLTKVKNASGRIGIFKGVIIILFGLSLILRFPSTRMACNPAEKKKIFMRYSCINEYVTICSLDVSTSSVSSLVVSAINLCWTRVKYEANANLAWTLLKKIQSTES